VGRWTNNHDLMLKEIGNGLSRKYRDQKVLLQALANPNSMFVPLDRITEVRSRRTLLKGNYIRISSPERSIILWQDFVRTIPIKAVYNYFVTGFQPDVVAMLSEKVRENSRSGRDHG